ncbi:MAG: efflux RND transporter periplasmic adaptor subunit [Planctomycetota bacterium]|jgi:HlyD family secretion protein
MATRFATPLLILPLICASLLFCGCSESVEVKETSPRTGKIQESFAEPAKTRLSKTYRITMPVNGRIGRIEPEPGYGVKAGQALAEFDLVPFEQAVAEAKALVAELEANITVAGDMTLENITLERAELAVNAAEDSLNASETGIEALRARAERAARELERKEKLREEKAVSDTMLDDTRLAAETATLELRREEFNRDSLQTMVVSARLARLSASEAITRKKMEKDALVHRLAQAKARLARAGHELKLASVKSPIEGTILEKYEQGDGTLAAGTPLLLIGNLEELEVVAEVMTQDAMRLGPGSDVMLEAAAGRKEIAGKVKLVEPAGFTKLSSLGVEQQRVKVIVSLEEKQSGLGVGYRLQARFLTGSKADALIVPRFSVMQAPDGSYYVYGIAAGKLVKKKVTIGLKSDLNLEILSGISDGEKIVAVPDTKMEDGMKAKVTGSEKNLSK